MKKTLIFALIALFVFGVSQCGLAAVEKVRSAAGVKGGLYAGTYGIGAEYLFRLPKVSVLKDLYLRASLSITDSQNVTSKRWHRFLPLSVDGVAYITNNLYAGAGLNFPLYMSDKMKGSLGGQIYVGAETAMWQGKIFADLGYGYLKTTSSSTRSNFDGINFIVGYRQTLGTIIVEEEKPAVVAAPVPEVAAPVAAPEIKAEEKAAEEIAIEEEVVSKGEIISYKIKPGDTLSQIALEHFGDPGLYPELAELNKIKNPDLIYAGQTLKIDLGLKR